MYVILKKINMFNAAGHLSSRVFLGGLWALTALGLIYSFRFGFDLSDEGVYLYYLKQGISEAYFQNFHMVLGGLGSLFDHNLWVYRSFGVLIFTFSSWALIREVSRHSPLSLNLQLLLLFACFFYYVQFPATPSYNLVSLVFVQIMAWSLLRLHRKPSLLAVVILGAALTGLFFAKHTTGLLATLCLGPFFIWWSSLKFKKIIKFLLWIILTAVALMIFLSLVPFSELLEVNRVMGSSTHSLSQVAAEHLRFFGLFFILLPGLSWVLLRFQILSKEKLKWTGLVLILLYLSYYAVDFFFQGPRFSKFTSGVFTLLGLYLGVFLFEQRTQKNPNQVALVLLLALCTLLPAAGTNNPLRDWLTGNLVTALLTLAVLRPSYHLRLQKLLGLSLLIFCLAGLAYKRTYDLYRQPTWDQLQHEVKNSSVLKGIQMPEDQARILSAVLAESEKLPPNARWIVLYDLPGLLSVVEQKALGSAWYVSGYSGADRLNCAFLNFSVPEEKSQVFLLKTGAVSKELQSCLDQKLTATEVTQQKGLGHFKVYRNPDRVKVILQGPFEIAGHL